MSSDVRERATNVIAESIRQKWNLDQVLGANTPLGSAYVLLDDLEFAGLTIIDTAAASGPVEVRVMDAIDERAGWNGRDDAYILKRDDIKQAVRAALAPASEEGA